MDYITIIAATLTAIGVLGIAFLGGYERGLSNAKPVLASRPTVAELIKELPKRKRVTNTPKRRPRK